jgi:hypothetical protein
MAMTARGAVTDFATFWRQAAQQGFRRKIAQAAETGLFPSQVEALGSIGKLEIGPPHSATDHVRLIHRHPERASADLLP